MEPVKRKKTPAPGNNFLGQPSIKSKTKNKENKSPKLKSGNNIQKITKTLQRIQSWIKPVAKLT